MKITKDLLEELKKAKKQVEYLEKAIDIKLNLILKEITKQEAKAGRYIGRHITIGVDDNLLCDDNYAETIAKRIKESLDEL